MVRNISITILTKNSEKYIRECLFSLQAFDEIILLDNGSTDQTLQIATTFSNVKIYKNEFIGFGPLKNLAISYATNKWILSIDSDEIVTKELVNEISNLDLKKQNIYSIQRNNYYNKKLIKCCGWQNDYVDRLFHKEKTQFNDKLVHESLILSKNINIKKLKNSFKHYSFDNAKELIEKMQKYSSLYAKEHKNIKKATPKKAFLRGLFTFFKNYFFQKGFLCGYEGLIISISNANGAFYKYIKLYEENKK